MRKAITSLIAIAAFCWGIISVLSVLGDLRFLIDAWTWSLNQVPLSLKTVLLEIGRRVSAIVGGYRHLLRGILRILQIPELPQVLLDTLGILCFSLARAWRLGPEHKHKSWERGLIFEDPSASRSWPYRVLHDPYPLIRLAYLVSVQIERLNPTRLNLFSKNHYRVFGINVSDVVTPVCVIAIYAAAITIVVSILFAVDYLYLYFAPPA